MEYTIRSPPIRSEANYSGPQRGSFLCQVSRVQHKQESISFPHKFDNLVVSRYDGSGLDLVATGSADSTVKVWDTANGQLRATLRSGGSSNSIISCDISNGVVVAGGCDKTCRVWNLRTQRMVCTQSQIWHYLFALADSNSHLKLLRFTIWLAILTKSLACGCLAPKKQY
jgi:WD40 repeat protein